MPKAKKLIVLGIDAISLPIVKRFAQEGSLPHFKRLMEKGSISKALPCLPAYTPTNWATIATGAYPGAHGAGNWDDRSPGDPSDRKPLSTFDSRTITAETIWQVAEREGKRSLIAAYPGAFPSRLKNGFVIVPLQRGLVSHKILSGAVYSTEEGEPKAIQVLLKDAKNWLGDIKEPALEGEITIGLGPEIPLTGPAAAKAVGATEDGADQAVIDTPAKSEAKPKQSAALRLNILLQSTSGNGFDQLVIAEGKDASSPLARLSPGEWSPWMIREIPSDQGPQSGSMRFKLLELSPDGKRLRLVRSEIYPTTSFTEPESLSEELIKEAGPYIEHAGLPLSHDLKDYETILEEMQYQVDWHIKAAKYLQETKGWQIYYLHWHFPDSVQHRFLPGADPASPVYDAGEASDCVNVLRQAYKLGDRLLGGFMQLADNETIVVAVSDHGHTADMFNCTLPKRLQEAGLLSYSGGPGSAQKPPGKIDWSRTRAYPHGGFQICVNLKGREPQGIVEPKDFEAVQEEIIDALLDWREPESGKRAVAFALKNKDAPLVGYWGKRAGDVVFIYNSGFSWGATKGDATIGPAAGAHHGPQITTTETEFSSNLALLMMAGPGVKQGFERDYEQLSYARLVDLVPTFCHLLGIRPPIHSQGAVLSDLLE